MAWERGYKERNEVKEEREEKGEDGELRGQDEVSRGQPREMNVEEERAQRVREGYEWPSD